MKFQPRLDNQLWSQFNSAVEREDYCRCWLTLQCSILQNVIQGLVILSGENQSSFAPVVKWPEEGGSPERLTEISERVIEEKCGMLVELDHGSKIPQGIARSYGVAYPILAGEGFYGLVALEVKAGTEEELKYTMEQLQWGISWMELMLRREREHEAVGIIKRLNASVDLLADAISRKNYTSACLSFVTELATYLSCDRVSLGYIRNKKIKLQAVSHSSRVSENMNLVRAVIKAMDEAASQQKDIFYPVSIHERQIIRDHEALSKEHGSAFILSIPFYDENRYVNIITLERSRGHYFTDDEAMYCKSIGSLILPVLKLMHEKEMPLPLKISAGAGGGLKKVLGAHHTGRKLFTLLIVFLIIFFSVKEWDYRLSATTHLEGAVKRVIVAPFEGYIKDAYVRAGDQLEKGEKLCVMDDRELRLERLNWISKSAQYAKQYQEAQAKRERAEAEIIKAQLDQAKAKLELTESQIERALLVSPFKGMVISGDLSQRLGGAAVKGEILFEVAPLDEYRIILDVDERRIADVVPGQKGYMILSALPSEKIPFIIDKITPVATAKEGLNFFRVEATPSMITERLRPGMDGIGKINIDRRRLISIWTRSMREWFIIKFWQYRP
jgi:multidrug resistance efflux pump